MYQMPEGSIPLLDVFGNEAKISPASVNVTLNQNIEPNDEACFWPASRQRPPFVRSFVCLFVRKSMILYGNLSYLLHFYRQGEPR